MAGLEKSDEEWLRDECKARGLRAIKLDTLTGIPDRLLLGNEARVIFAELKTPIGSLSPMQRWWQNKLRSLGFWCECVNRRERLVVMLDWLETGKRNDET